MIKTPFRILTVTQGREVLGTIQQKGQRRFVALLALGKSLGVFEAAADAAQAISQNFNVVREGQ